MALRDGALKHTGLSPAQGMCGSTPAPLGVLRTGNSQHHWELLQLPEPFVVTWRCQAYLRSYHRSYLTS